MTKIHVLENIAAQLANLARQQLAEIEAGSVDMTGYVALVDPAVVRQSDGSFIVRVVESTGQQFVMGAYVEDSLHFKVVEPESPKVVLIGGEDTGKPPKRKAKADD